MPTDERTLTLKTTLMRALIFGYIILLGEVLDWSWTVFGIANGFLREGNPLMVVPLATAPLTVLAVKVAASLAIIPLYVFVAKGVNGMVANVSAIALIVVAWMPNVAALVLAIQMAMA